MAKSPRCLYESKLEEFLNRDKDSIFGSLCANYHGDADLQYKNGKWHYFRFNGQTKWVEQIGNTESKREQMKYMLNAYRVLLTRARAGMIICVPEGNGNKTLSVFWEDSTRLPEFYDGTYNYLKSLGIEKL